MEHPNPDRYAGQRIFVVQREDYVYLVPFVEDEHSVFLKTIIPSRKIAASLRFEAIVNQVSHWRLKPDVIDDIFLVCRYSI